MQLLSIAAKSAKICVEIFLLVLIHSTSFLKTCLKRLDTLLSFCCPLLCSHPDTKGYTNETPEMAHSLIATISLPGNSPTVA